MIFLYDGTFEGFLTCIYDHYYVKKASAIYNKNNFQSSLIDESVIINSNPTKWQKVLTALKQKLTTESLNHINSAFLSYDSNKDTYLLNYITYGFKIGVNLDNDHTNNFVLPVHKLSKTVSFEAHRFLGILRFNDISGTLYSTIEPDNNILILIADHFADRLNNEKFIIHDKKRGKAILYYQNEWVISNFKDIPIFEDEHDQYFQKLWKGYFKQIGIEGRKNLKLQQNFVPLKYRKNIIEFR